MQALSELPENISQASAFFTYENGCAQSELRCHSSLIRWACSSQSTMLIAHHHDDNDDGLYNNFPYSVC